MIYKLLTISLLFLVTSCQDKPDKAKESTIKDKEGNVSEFAVNFSPLTTIYKKRMGNEVESFYDSKFNSKDFSGSFLVAKNGEILYENYSGYAYKEKGDSIKQNTPLHIASVSKVITAVTILKLVDAKKLKLDDFVTSILPAFSLLKSRKLFTSSFSLILLL